MLDCVDWTTEDWEKVLFTDETILEINSRTGRVHVQRPVGEAFNPKYLAPKIAHPEKLNAWACFSAKGPGRIHVFDDNLNASGLNKILQRHVVDAALKMWPNEQWYYQQDNNPKHRAHIVHKFFHNSGVMVLDHPPYSPDLNPIENLWEIIRTRVDDRKPKDLVQLKQFWEEEWDKTTDEER